MRSVGNICSVGDPGTGVSAGDPGTETAPVGRRYSARWVYVEGRISGRAGEVSDGWETYNDQNTKNSKPKKSKVDNKDMPAKESKQIIEGMRWFGYDAKYGDEDGTRGNEEGTDKHVVRKYVAQQQTGEKCIPQEGDRSKGCEDYDWQCSNLKY